MQSGNLLPTDSNDLEAKVNHIIEYYDIDKRHINYWLNTDEQKQGIIQQAEGYEKGYGSGYPIVHPKEFWQTQINKLYDNWRYRYYSEWLDTGEISEEELNKVYACFLKKCEIDEKYIPYINRNRFLSYVELYLSACEDGATIDSPAEEVKRRCERLLQVLAETAEQRAKEEAEEREYNALAAKGQFSFDSLLIQRQKDSVRFLLPNEGYKAVTAYEIIERLTGAAFKSYKKQIVFKNDKIQILPFSERIRLVFYFRQQYRSPKTLDNATTVAAFINTGLKYTDNIELSQNWNACLDATSTQEEAVTLFAYYGWAATYSNEFPRTENVFYTVEPRNGERRYNIVEDSITTRFT